jgi:hypothetical protein
MVDAAPDPGDPCPDPSDGGAPLACNSDRCCAVGGQVCGLIQSGAAYCSDPFASGDDFGADCSGFLSGNSGCQSGVCLSTTGQCSAICAADSDCTALSSAALCHGFVTPAVGFCVTGCTGDPSCPTGRICVLRDDAQRDRIDNYCRVAPTTGADPGAPCTSGGQCRHGICAFVGLDQFCASPCATNADCPAAVPECREFPFLTPESGSTVLLGLCSTP